MRLDGRITLQDLVTRYPFSSRVLHRHGMLQDSVDGRRTLAWLCQDANASVDTVLDEIRGLMV